MPSHGHRQRDPSFRERWWYCEIGLSATWRSARSSAAQSSPASCLLSLDRVARSLERDIGELLNRLRNRHPEGAVALARQAQRCGMDQGQLYTLLLVDIAARTPGYSLQIISGASPTRKIIAGELEGHIALLCAPHDASLIATHVQNAIEKRMGLCANILRSANFTAAAEFPEVYAAARRCLDLMRACLVGKA